jgi:RNA 3'-phosphate cyclase
MAEEETHFKIRGGTDVKWAPPWDYFQNVFLKLLEKMGCYIDAYLNQRGYYPAGGGEIEVYVEPCELQSIEFNEKVEKIKGIVNIANLPSNIAERIEKAAMEELRKHDMDADIAIEETSAKSAGVGIVLWSEPKVLGSDCLGERGKPAEEVGKEAATKLIQEIKSNADLDEKAVDQLLPYLAMTGGKIKARNITKHAETEMWLLKKFIDVDFKIKKNGLYLVEVVK